MMINSITQVSSTFLSFSENSLDMCLESNLDVLNLLVLQFLSVHIVLVHCGAFLLEYQRTR